MVKVIVTVRLKPGVLDPQGQAVMKGLNALGYEAVADVRFGKQIELRLNLADEEQRNGHGRLKQSIDAMCRDLLANPVIEEYTFEIVKEEA
ncbi:MAG TPA: phosphoribosylformylglycinamidine synthase subunit PurS [Firmicutes bacterium]|nr:phosphoribosylformylglycinamidine synthase subunit PurS [Bacillota bacterium]